MTSMFVWSFVLLAVGTIGWILAGLAAGDEDESSGMLGGGVVIGLVFTAMALLLFRHATMVEVTCSNQGMHTIAGECVKLVTNGS